MSVMEVGGAVAEEVVDQGPAGLDGLDEQLLDQLVGQAKALGVKLAGEGGLLQSLTKRLLESALEGEITDHLGYDRHDGAGDNTGNSRNGRRSGLVEAVEIVAKVEGISFVYFNERDVVRHSLGQRISRAYEEYESSKAENRNGRVDVAKTRPEPQEVIAEVEQT